MVDIRPPADPLRRERAVGAPKIGSYLVGNVIGKGGFGSVYKALDQQRAHFVAIKQLSVHGIGASGPRGQQAGHGVLSSGDLGSIEMEISLLSKLNHRNIVKYIDSIRTEHHLNIVLEFVEGGSLASILKKFGAFPESLCAIYTLQILKGLKYLHSQGVIHRDIKGANVLTTKTGLVKLADFGVATKLSEVDSSRRRVVGTPYWMAPEIVEMSPPTPACDIWSVGSTVVEMVTEKPPYADLQQVSALYRIVSDPHPPVPECVSHSLELFLLSCFEKNPMRRASAGDLIEDDWIVTNKKATMEFNRKMLSPAIDQSQDEPDEEPDEDAELLGTITTFMGTVRDGKEGLLGALSHPGGGIGGSAMTGVGAGDAGAASSTPAPLSARGPVASQPSLGATVSGWRGVPVGAGEATTGPEASRAGGAEEAQAEEGVGAVGAAVGAGGATTVSAAAASETVAIAEAPASVLQEERTRFLSETTQNEYHFAFLDYYHKHSVAAAADRAPLPPRATAVAPAADEERPGSADNERTKSLSAAMEHDTADGERPQSTVGSLVAAAPALRRAAPRGLRQQLGASRGGAETPLPPAAPPRGEDEASERSPGDQAMLAQSKERQREASEIKQLLGSIRPFEEPDVLVGICKRLTELLQQGSSNEDSNLHLVMQHGAVPIVEMLQVTDPTLLRTVLKVVNQIVEGNQGFQEIFAMVGLIPGVIKFARPCHSRPLRYEAACFIFCLCNTSARSLQMLVACGGLEALVDLLSHDYYHNRDLVWLALDALSKVFDSASQNNQNSDFCRILAKHGLCGHLCLLVDTLAGDIHERASHYLEVVVKLLLFFAKEGDAVVKVYMAKGSVLEGLIAGLDFLPPDLAIQTCKTFKYLAQEPSVLNMLENAGVVPVLVHFLSLSCGPEATKEAEESGQTSLQPRERTNTLSQSQDACSQCLLALFYLCKLSRPRQEQAALAGAVPLLQELVGGRHSLRVYAFVMLCDMTCASLATRRILWAQGGVAFLVRCLHEPELQTFALEALVGWLGVREHRANWCERLEGVLLQDGDFLRHLLVLFQSVKPTVFLKVLDPLLKLARISKEIKAALAGSDEFFQELVQRLKVGRQLGVPTVPEAVGHSGSADSAASSRGSTPTLRPSQVRTIGGAALPGSPPTSPAPVVVLPKALEPALGAGPSDGLVTPPFNSVRRLISGPTAAADDDVRARTHLLRLLLLLCQAQEAGQLAVLCRCYRLQALMHHVLLEEKRSKRVILCEIALQLLGLFDKVLPAECSSTI